MHQGRSQIKLPESEDTVLWRYLNLGKFIYMIQTSRLFFANAECLDDPAEGTLYLEKLGSLLLAVSSVGRTEAYRLELDRQLAKKLVLISSWHANPEEQDAMWKIYAGAGEGLAIKSTYGRLRRSFERNSEFDVCIGQVQYGEPPEPTNGSGHLQAFFWKRAPFSYENEVRAVIDLYSHYAPRGVQKRKEGASTVEPVPGVEGDPVLKSIYTESGLNVSVDLAILIDQVVLSPYAPRWMLQVVRELVAKFAPGPEVRPSILAEK